MVTRRNTPETPGSGKPKRTKNSKPQPDGVAKRRSANPKPDGDGWSLDEDGNWCFGSGCFNVKIPTDGKPVSFTFEQECPEEVVDAVTKSARRGTEYYIKPRGG